MFIRHLYDLIRFMYLPKQQRRLVFYSEGKNYWPHLERLVKNILETSDIPLCYISSDKGDPGLLLKHTNHQTFLIDEGFIRNWLFENIETDIMVMTMPDLHQYQVKRSKHDVHYVYVQHSLVSLHMVYRKGAFDHYDTIFCAGPHHVKEIRAMEEKYKLPAKNLVEHGYGRLDAIIEEAKKRSRKDKLTDAPIHILIAPSWGSEATVESGKCEHIVEQLIEQGYRVTLRPHPLTLRLAKNKVGAILEKYKNHPMFNFEANVAGQETLHDSDVMISDWSGAALEYAFGLNKPVLFVDVPRKINNPQYQEIDVEPFEVSCIPNIGKILMETEGKYNFQIPTHLNINLSEAVFHPEKSSQKGTAYLLKLIES